MIAEGKSRGGARQLASHLLKTENESVKVLAIRGCFYDDVNGALIEMEERALLTSCSKPLYHAHLDWKEYERLGDDQQIEAIDRLGRHLGLENQPVAIVQHVKKGRMHVHAVWSRIDLENERAISDSHNYRKHELAAREIEQRYGLERVQGAHIERDGQPRPERGFEKWQFQQAHHSDGSDPRDFRQEVRQAWQQSDNGAAFLHALDDKGYLLSNGDKRNSFVVVDRSGDIVALKTTTVGAPAADIRAKLADIDCSTLPGVEQARQQQEIRQREQQEATGRGAIVPAIEAQPIVPAIDTETGAAMTLLQRSTEPDKARGMMRAALDYLGQLGQAQGDTPARALPPKADKSVPDPIQIEKSALEKGFNIFESVAGGIVDMFSGHLNDGQGVEPYRTSSVEQTEEARLLAEKQAADAKLTEEKQSAEQKQTDEKLAAEKQGDELNAAQQQTATEQQAPSMYDTAVNRQAESIQRAQLMREAMQESMQSDEPVAITEEEYNRRIEEERALRQDGGIRR